MEHGMKTLLDYTETYGTSVRLIKLLRKRESPHEYPEQCKWKLQMLYFNGEQWIELCRIDNYPHENSQGSHIHVYRKTGVQRIALTFEQAEKTIKELSERILKEKFNTFVSFI